MTSPAEIDWEAAKQQRAAGQPWSRIAADLGVGVECVRRHLDGGFAAKRNARWRELMKRRIGERVASARLVVSHDLSAAEVAAALASVPPDTRDLTGRILGDPLPERSALTLKTSKPHLRELVEQVAQ